MPPWRLTLPLGRRGDPYSCRGAGDDGSIRDRCPYTGRSDCHKCSWLYQWRRTRLRVLLGVSKDPPLGIMRMNWIRVNLPSQLLRVAAGGGKGPYSVRTAGPDGNGRLPAATVAVDPLGLTPGYTTAAGLQGPPPEYETKTRSRSAAAGWHGTPSGSTGPDRSVFASLTRLYSLRRIQYNRKLIEL